VEKQVLEKNRAFCIRDERGLSEGAAVSSVSTVSSVVRLFSRVDGWKARSLHSDAQSNTSKRNVKG
jgi:hypothetical protein